MNESSKTKEKKSWRRRRQIRMAIELTNKSWRASGSHVDDVEIVGSRRNLERTAGWANSVAQQSVPNRQLSQNVVIKPPKSVTQDKIDKRFSAYPKTSPLFQPCAGLPRPMNSKCPFKDGQHAIINGAEWTTRTYAEVKTVFQLPETWQLVEKLHK